MKLVHNGLVKVIEECGELIQAAAKLMQSPDSDTTGLSDEMADVLATITYVADQLDLDSDYIGDRAEAKAKKFSEWAQHEN